MFSSVGGDWPLQPLNTVGTGDKKWKRQYLATSYVFCPYSCVELNFICVVVKTVKLAVFIFYGGQNYSLIILEINEA